MTTDTKQNPAGAWSPIETAPKDGTEIIYRDARLRIGSCSFWTAARCVAEQGGHEDEYCPGWYDDRRAPDQPVEPIEYIPLPPPPPEKSE